MELNGCADYYHLLTAESELFCLFFVCILLGINCEQTGTLKTSVFFFCSYQISVEIIVYIFIVSSLLLYYLSSLYSVITCNIVSCAFFDKKKNGIDSSILQTKLVSFSVKCQLKLSLLIMRHLWEGLIWNLYNDTSIYSMIFRRACG